MQGRFREGSKRKNPGDDTSQATPPKRSRINIHEDSRRIGSEEATTQAGSSKKTITDTHEKDRKRGRDSDDDSEQSEPSKKSRPDSIQNDSKRMDATKKVLDVLLKPPEREQTPREQEVYRQSLEEVQRLNTGDFAINAHNDDELALYAARRAHLKALISPGDFPDDEMKKDWKPGGKWAQRAKSSEKYEWEVHQAKSKHQQLEQECPIASLNNVIRYSESNRAISDYKGESQQKQQERYEKLKAKLERIRDYLEGKPIGIAKADSAWRWIKEAQANSNYIAIVDLRQLLNLSHQETTSSSKDQTKTSQETTSSSPHYALAQQHFEQFLRHAEGMLKALPDNEFKITSQARYDDLIITYTTMTPDTATTSQLQEVYTQMKTLHYDLAQQHFEQSRRTAQGILEVLPADEFKTTNQERLNALITTFTTITPDTTTPSQLQEVSTQMKDLHYALAQWHFEQLRRDAEDMLKALPDNEFKITSQEGYNALITSYKKMDLVNRIPSQLQEVYTQMTTLCEGLIQQHFEHMQERFRDYLEEITAPDFPDVFQNRFNDLEQMYQSASNINQRQDTHQQMRYLYMRILQWNFKKSKEHLQKFVPGDKEEEFERIITKYEGMDHEFDKTYHYQQKMENIHDRMMLFHEEQAYILLDSARIDAAGVLSMLAQDSFKAENQAKFDTLEKSDTIRKTPLFYRWQDALDKMLAFYHKLAQQHLQQSKADIKILLNLTQQDSAKDDLHLNNLESNWNDLGSAQNESVKLEQARSIFNKLQNFHYQLIEREIQSLLTQIKDPTRKKQSQEDFSALQTEYSVHLFSDPKRLAFEKMKDLHRDLFPLNFEQHHSSIQYFLHHYIQDPKCQSQYQQQLDALQATYQTSSNLDSQQWRQGLQEIIALRSTVLDRAWKDDFERLQAKIDKLLQGLQEDVIEDRYRKTYAKLQQRYEKLSQGGQKLGASDTTQCHREMLLFHKKLLEVSETNRQKYELKDDTKEMEHYAKDLEETLQRHMGRAHRVWSENEQGQSITYAHFTDPEGNKHLKEKVEVVNGTNTKTHEAVQGYYCPKTQHFISSDHQTVHEAQLTSDQQLKLKDTRETPWEHQIRQWAKPADTQARLILEEAKQRIWKVLSRQDSPALLELSLGFHGSYLSKTTISGSDADIHVAFNNRSLNNPFHNDLPKYREIMDNALIEAFTKQHATIYETVTTIDEKAFGTKADVFPAFYHTFEGGHKGLISFTKDEKIVTHFLEQKRQNAQAKSESTAYQFRNMIRIIKYLRNRVLEEIHGKPYDELEESQQMPSFILEALVHNTPNEHFVDSTPEGKPIKRDLAATLDRVLAYCIDHTATDETCKEWKEVDGIKYLFNHDANTPWDMELKGEKYTYTGKHNIPREHVHAFLQRLHLNLAQISGVGATSPEEVAKSRVMSLL